MVKYMQAIFWPALVLNLVVANEYFSIVGPQSVRFGEDFEVYLSTSNYNVSENLEISLWTHKRVEVEKFVFRLPVKSQKVVFNLKAQHTRQNYTLYSEIPSRNLARNTNIYMSECDYVVLIQTDKNVYKAGEKVFFRILAVDADLKPYQMKKMVVYITDVNENVVLRKTTPLSSNGSTDDHILLSSDAIIGKWEIHVKIDNDIKESKRSFEVRRYHQTRFEAIIDTNPIIYSSDVKMRITVYAKYIISANEIRKGDFTKGRAWVNVETLKRTYGSPYHVNFENVTMIEGKTDLFFDLRKDLDIANRKELVKISLIFEETSSGFQESAEKIVVVKRPHTALFEINRDEYFKPGIPYSVDVVLVRHRNESLIQHCSLTVIYYDGVDCGEALGQRKFKIGGQPQYYDEHLVNGTSHFTFPTYTQNSGMHLKLTFGESSEVLNVLRAPSRTRRYIKAKILSDGRLRENQKIQVEVFGSKQFESINVVVLGGHRILFSNTFKDIGQNPYTFELFTNADMLPEAIMFVYYHEPLGEIIYDRIKLKFDEDISNPNHLQSFLSENEVKKWKNATFSIDLELNSMVYLYAVGVDIPSPNSQTEHLTADGSNLITELRRHFNKPDFERTKKKRYSDFTDSSAFILTDADRGSFKCADT